MERWQHTLHKPSCPSIGFFPHQKEEEECEEEGGGGRRREEEGGGGRRREEEGGGGGRRRRDEEGGQDTEGEQKDIVGNNFVFCNAADEHQSSCPYVRARMTMGGEERAYY